MNATGQAPARSHNGWLAKSPNAVSEQARVVREYRNCEGGGAEVKKDGKWGFGNTSGKMKIPPQFEEVWAFNKDGLTTVKSGGKWGYIKRNGKFRVPARFDQAWTFDGIAGVKLDGKWGYIHDNGKVVFGL